MDSPADVCTRNGPSAGDRVDAGARANVGGAERFHERVHHVAQAARKGLEGAFAIAVVDCGLRIGLRIREGVAAGCRAVRSASTRRGNSARTERRSTSPAWMPASSGSARYVVASRPKRRVMNAPIDSSAFVALAAGRTAPHPFAACRATKKRRAREWTDARRDAEHRRRRQRVQAPASLDVGDARRLGGHEPIAETDFAGTARSLPVSESAASRGRRRS